MPRKEMVSELVGSSPMRTGCRVPAVEELARFPSGAVLVARTTNPAWTTLFYRACAVVTESGGPLSHGAVTAREVGIPAVMAVHGVLECSLLLWYAARVISQRGGGARRGSESARGIRRSVEPLWASRAPVRRQAQVPRKR